MLCTYVCEQQRFRYEKGHTTSVATSQALVISQFISVDNLWITWLSKIVKLKCLN